MESLYTCLSSSPHFQNHTKTHKKSYPKSLLFLPNNSVSNSTPHPPNSCQTHFPRTTPTPPTHNTFHLLNRILKTHPPNSLTKNLSILKTQSSPFQILFNTHFSFLCLGFSFPCFASETTIPTDQVSNKINLEAILVSINDFFHRYPFFVSGVTFIWLVVIPLTEEYLQKFKFISAINAFRKLRDDPSAQLLDIRDDKSLRRLSSPILKILNKKVLQVEYTEADEEGFVKKVLEKLREPANTTICILDNFDDNSLKVAELLFKNGFREAYAIRGGVKGKNGWLAIQETLLPPSVHIFPRKKGKKLQQLEKNGADQQSITADQSSAESISRQTNNGYISKSSIPNGQIKSGTRSLSPYPKYPDLKPPSSPTPSKPKN